MKTEVINTLILLFSAVVLAIIVYINAGSWTDVWNVANAKSENMTHLILPNSDKSMPWLGLVLGVPLLGFYFWCNNQFIVQRALSAKNIDEGRKGALFAGLLKIPVLFLLVIPGIMAIKLLPSLNDSSATYPTLLFQYLPMGLIGLTIAGFLAAMASAVSATLNSASTLISMDIIQKLRPDLSGKQMVKVGQISTVFFMIIAVLWAPQISKFNSFMDYMQGVLALISPPVVAVFLLGLFSKRTTSAGAFTGLITGMLLGVFVVIAETLQTQWVIDIPFLFKAPIIFSICFVVTVFVSMMTEKPHVSKIENIVWNKELYTHETAAMKNLPWYQNYRVYSFILIVLTCIVVFLFR
jgi:SSS family solute:Na+ symporter